MKGHFLTLLATGLLTLPIFAQTAVEKVTHKVEAGQTLFFISKKYNTSIDDIRALNPEIGEDLIIKPEQVIFVNSNVKPVQTNTNFKVHTVDKGETLYSLSKQYGVTVDELIQMNNLETPSIQLGQTIRVKKLNVNEDALFTNSGQPTIVVDTPEITEDPSSIGQETEIAVETPVETIEIPDGDSDLYKTLFDSYEGQTLNKEKGIANFLEQGSDDSYLALVNGVPQNQVIRVRNLMNNKIIYLKVVGELPQKDADNNISLKVSKAAAKDLNIIEDRFLAEWTWYNVELSSPAKEDVKKEFVPYDDF